MAESLVAVAVLALLLTPMLSLLTASRWALTQARGKAAAQAIARARLEELTREAAADYARVAEGTFAPDPDLYPGYSGEVRTEVEMTRRAEPVLKRVTVIVRWQGTAGRTFSYQLVSYLRRRG